MGKGHCPDNLSGEHEPDEAELVTVDPEEETALIRFVCSQCGGEGVMMIHLDDIEWEDMEDEEIEE